MTRRRGLTYLEVLAAAVLVAMAAAAALSTWQLTSRAPANKRLTEMGSLLAVREIERLKAFTYLNLPDVAANNATVTYYDKNGLAASPNAAVSGGYKVKSWVIA